MINVRGITAQSGERVRGLLPVTTLANGLELSIPVHIVNGKKPGPKLMLTALSHGDATTGFDVIRRVLNSVDVDQLSGAIVAIPCQNPVAFEWDSRNTPTDSYNMNRSYPGNTKGWFTEQLTAAISPVCEDIDALIDWHGGGYNCCINYVLLKNTPDPDFNEKVLQMGLAYGLENLYDGKPAGPAANYTGSLTEYATSLGKPTIVAEVGSGGVQPPFDMVGLSVRGVYNVMKHMGMYPGEIELPPKQWLAKTRPLLRPKNGGMFYPMCGPEYLNKVVPEGTLLAQVVNPLTLEVIEEMYAPCKETVFFNMRAGYGKVHPGDYAYILADRSDARVFENY